MMQTPAKRFSFSKLLKRDWREWLTFLLFVGPNLGLFVYFTYYPLIRNVLLSFQDYNTFIDEGEYIGLTNFVDVFTDSQTSVILRNTLVFTVAVVGIILVLGLMVALLLNQKLRFRNGVRSLIFSPTVLAGSAVAVVWIYIFDPRTGLILQLAKPFGINPPAWLLDPASAMIALIIVYVWKNLGYATVIYVAGLQAIPADLFEAARVDGANAVQRFRHVTIPGLSPVIFFLAVTSVLTSFQAFDLIRVMTGGGPINATNVLIYRLYEVGFGTNSSIGRASVIGLILFVIMLVVTILQLRYLERRVSYA
ncbi:MAG TPA: sugar ABC transporter permease [Thermoflexales bacterium]|jgi:multiple sugar transport system permease protein/sn-glycerol 3-phosphate transport system permease protein|nr:sugar ABC transporter permease [Thermoflexales bacterium]HQX09732.1 sugar ABC transporter permease [Thermoflexales bacterium]HQY25276.1 sugar ABC transporter permease [Thermoflexales bacterium]HQZ53958.1 sugar ABC transporter permease [Thermoflexales bacterium]HRA52514.1 sugar ABC transporter permease [Thermoflexales bacterium]